MMMDNFHVMGVYQNVRGLRTKTNTFYQTSSQSVYDFMALTETWLHEGIHSAEIFPSSYNVYRQDRSRIKTGKGLGGGCLLAVSVNYSCERVFLNEIEETECDYVWVKTKFHQHGPYTHIGVFYFVPNTNAETYTHVCDVITSHIHSMEINEELLILGDFNLPTFQISHCSDNNPIVASSRDEALLDFIHLNNLASLNTVKNIKGSTLDLVLTSTHTSTVTRDNSLVPLEDQYHPTLQINILEKVPRSKNIRKHTDNDGKVPILNYAKADFTKILESVKTQDWTEFYSINDPNEAAVYFQNAMESLVLSSVPTRCTGNDTRSYPPWFTPQIIHAIKSKERERRKLRKKHPPSSANVEKFRALRTLSKKLIKNAYEAHMTRTENNLRENPQKFWNFIKNQKNSRSTTEEKEYKGRTYTSSGDITKAFASHFSSVYVPDTLRVDHGTSPRHAGRNIIRLRTILKSDVVKAFEKLKPKRSLGPDRIPAYVYKGCREYLVAPLHHLFNLCITHRVFPLIWRVTKVTPVPKTGNSKDIENHRPIAIPPVPAKIFESILLSLTFDQVGHQIITNQHGFFPKRNTTTNLASLTEYVLQEMNDGKQVDAVYTDFSKAFDKVNHRILLRKMGDMCFSEDLICLFSSYLEDRCQYVSYRGYESNRFLCPSGVPQGSHLGPFLFLLFINDIVDNVSFSRVLLYADDMKLFRSIGSIQDSFEMQQDLNTLVVWSEENCLPFNINKCEKITFSRKNKNEIPTTYKIFNTTLKTTDTVKDLGVYIDKKISFVPHITQLVRKAKKTMGFILRNSKNFRNFQTLKLLYYALVRSQLESGMLIWNPISKKYIDVIEGIQRHYLKIVYSRIFQYYPFDLTYTELLEGFEMDSLENRRKVALVGFLYDILRGHIDNSNLLQEIPLRIPRTTRRKATFYVKPVQTKAMQHAVLNRACGAYNEMEEGGDISNTNMNVDIFFHSRREFKQISRDIIRSSAAV